MRKTGKRATALFAAGVILAGSLATADGVLAAKLSSAEQAKQKAMQKVPNAVVTDVDSDHENGQQVYEIELVKSSRKFELVYRASDGKLLAYGWEKTAVSPERSSSVISTQKCRQLALGKVKNGTITAISQKVDDGIDIYKVKVTAGNRRYTLEYHARTGALLEYKWKLTASASSGGQSGKISMEKAKQIALDAVPGAAVHKAEYDTDDGAAVYEIEVIKGNYEYEFKIDADTGAILEQDKDLRD